MKSMNHYLITIQYDGTAHAGWQRLADNPNTIQQILENALSGLLSETIRITGSGRTDAGVHALCQCADFYCKKEITPDILNTFPAAMSRLLPDSIAVTSITVVGSAFHSRKSCVGKTYAYCTSLHLKPDIFARKYLYCPADTPLKLPHSPVLDYEAMQTAAGLLCGEHDFHAFTSDKSTEKSFVRTLENISIYEKDLSGGRILVMEFTGNGFLYNMVRILAGTLLFVGLNKIPAKNIPAILEAGKREAAGPTLPSNGLFLVRPYYEQSAYHI